VRRERHLFATRGDLEPGAQRIEAARRLQYVRTGMSASSSFETYRSLLDIPTLGTNETGSHVTGDCFLVLREGARVAVERVPQRNGGVMYAVDQGSNPGSIAFWPGGLYKDESLVCGHIGTVSESSESVELYDAFTRALLKGFTKVKSYQVGPEALRLLDEGRRLVTIGVRSPAEYDLRRD
jgi:hypothetical protein